VGRVSGNASILAESYKWYGVGIEKQRKILQALQSEKRLPTVEDICNAVLLSFFEIACSTSSAAYFQHIIGAARLVEMRGPEACSSGILQQLFTTLRIQLLHPAIIMRFPSFFATEEWLTIPFQGRRKSVYDKVMDVISVLSTIIFRLDATRSMQSSSEIRAQRLLLRTETANIKEQLDEWWDKDLRDASKIHGWNGDYFRGVPGFDVDYKILNYRSIPTDHGTNSTPPEDAAGTWYDIALPQTGLDRRFFAESRATAFYSAARLLTLSLLDDLDAPPARFHEQMQAHSESILSVTKYMTKLDIGYAYVRLVLPLTLVWTLSPLDAQRVRAKEVLSWWKEKGGVGGLCEVVLSTLPGASRRMP